MEEDRSDRAGTEHIPGQAHDAFCCLRLSESQSLRLPGSASLSLRPQVIISGLGAVTAVNVNRDAWAAQRPFQRSGSALRTNDPVRLITAEIYDGDRGMRCGGTGGRADRKYHAGSSRYMEKLETYFPPVEGIDGNYRGPARTRTRRTTQASSPRSTAKLPAWV